jgi:hypothetical protein
MHDVEPNSILPEGTSSIRPPVFLKTDLESETSDKTKRDEKREEIMQIETATLSKSKKKTVELVNSLRCKTFTFFIKTRGCTLSASLGKHREDR